MVVSIEEEEEDAGGRVRRAGGRVAALWVIHTVKAAGCC
jgi:hypothetical protein